MDLDQIEVQPKGALDRLDEGVPHPCHAIVVERGRFEPAGSIGLGRGRFRRPAAVAGGQRLATALRQVGGGLASGVRQLDAELIPKVVDIDPFHGAHRRGRVPRGTIGRRLPAIWESGVPHRAAALFALRA